LGVFAAFVVLAEADHRLADRVVASSFGRAAGVLGCDEVDFLQRPQARNDRSSRFPIGVATTNNGAGHEESSRDYPYNWGHVRHAMPLYEYQCEACGNRFELIRKFSDPPLETCVKCGANRESPEARLLAGLSFEGFGMVRDRLRQEER
jgi:putative FmdB family regulatory protein